MYRITALRPSYILKDLAHFLNYIDVTYSLKRCFLVLTLIICSLSFMVETVNRKTITSLEPLLELLHLYVARNVLWWTSFLVVHFRQKNIRKYCLLSSGNEVKVYFDNPSNQDSCQELKSTHLLSSLIYPSSIPFTLYNRTKLDNTQNMLAT